VNLQFEENQVVWAKIKGFPWWPAVITKLNKDLNGAFQKEVTVQFIEAESNVCLPLNMIANFEEHLEEHKATKPGKLMEAIEVAKKMIHGFSPED